MDEKGYHGTCSKYRDSIERFGLDPSRCKYRDDHWLGQGVYFYDDFDLARWWASTISSHHNNCRAMIFQSRIIAPENEVLNLDDYKQFDGFITATLETLEEIKQRCQGEMPIFEDSSFRAIFFDYYKEQNKISVIIGTFQKLFAGYTTFRSEPERTLQKKLMRSIGLKFHERQICVSKKECIKSTVLIYSEDEEVV